MAKATNTITVTNAEGWKAVNAAEANVFIYFTSLPVEVAVADAAVDLNNATDFGIQLTPKTRSHVGYTTLAGKKVCIRNRDATQTAKVMVTAY